jgi:hypothetical protein
MRVAAALLKFHTQWGITSQSAQHGNLTRTESQGL